MPMPVPAFYGLGRHANWREDRVKHFVGKNGDMTSTEVRIQDPLWEHMDASHAYRERTTERTTYSV